MKAFVKRVINRLKSRFLSRVRNRRRYLKCVSGQSGLEIGGPSSVFRPEDVLDIYQAVGRLDNCNFSRSTVWAEQQDDYKFMEGKPLGRSIFCEGSDLSTVPGGSYDFVLSSHNLEHFANPVKALFEWKRVLRPKGALILVLPYYKGTFDHRRQPTTVEHMFEDFDRNIGEDDLTHLPEILEKHDLSMDPGALSQENFHARSLSNVSNRCLHHHVFDENNSRALLERAGFTVRRVDKVYPMHLCLLATRGKV